MEPTSQKTATAQASEDKNLNLTFYFEILLKRRWALLVTFVAAVSLTAVTTMRQPKIYAASASIVIDMSLPQILGEGVREAVEVGSGAYYFQKEYYETQYKILKSRSVLRRVVEHMGLDRDPDFLGVTKLPAEQQQRVMENADAVGRLQGMVFIEPVKDSRIVNLRVEDLNAERAALIANELAQSYMQSNLERRVEGTKDAASWLQDQLTDLKGKLSSSELALFNFKKDNDLIYTSFENKQTIASQKLVAINDTLTRVRTKKAEVDAKVKGVRAAKQTNDLMKILELGVVASNNFVNALKIKYLEVSNEVAELNERYGAEYPKMQTALEKQRLARQNLQAEVDAILAANLAEYDEVVATEKNLEILLDQVKREAFENNKREIDYKRLARDEENTQRLYDLVLKRMKELDLSGMLKTNNIRMLDPAKVSYGPIKPNVRSRVLVAAVFGLLGGMGLAFLLEYQDRTIKGHPDVEALGLNFLGLIPSIPGGTPTQPAMRDLYIQRQSKSTVAECCRTIRTNLLFMSPDKPIKRMLVTSAGPQEGKTTALINIGITMAHSGNKVLLVDTDMRRPRLHKSFGVSNEVGVSSVIVGECALDDAIKSTEVPGLFILPSGPVPPNPAELLHTARFKELSDELATRFDRVAFDSPPIGAVADPLVLANQMDGTVLVLKMFRTNRDMAERAVRSLGDANANLLGAVLNDVDLEKRQYGYYLGYYYGYGRYYGEGKGQV